MCSKFLLISLSKFCCINEARSYAKVIHKKREKKKREEKETSVRDFENNGYSDARLKRKKREKMNIL
jgi:hypothetical protein